MEQSIIMRYHPIAKTNSHIRKLIQESDRPHRELAKRFGVNPKTILKWKHRDTVEDSPRGTKTVKYKLTKWEQRIIVKARKHLKVPLDDLVIIVQKYIPNANRSNVYRVLKRHKLNRLPVAFKGGQGKFGTYLPGFLHVDLCYLPILPESHQRRYLLVAIDRITKLVYVKMVIGKTQSNAVDFLKEVIAWYPYRIHRILTDNGKEFGKKFTDRCLKYGAKHKRTKVKHPWTNGQVERMNGIIKSATVKKKYYPNYKQLWKDLTYWQNDYNSNRKLKSLKGLTPYQKMIEYYESLSDKKRQERFRIKPSRKLLWV
jgi:transposase InsO family protein